MSNFTLPPGSRTITPLRSRLAVATLLALFVSPALAREDTYEDRVFHQTYVVEPDTSLLDSVPQEQTYSVALWLGSVQGQRLFDVKAIDSLAGLCAENVSGVLDGNGFVVVDHGQGFQEETGGHLSPSDAQKLRRRAACQLQTLKFFQAFSNPASTNEQLKSLADLTRETYRSEFVPLSAFGDDAGKDRLRRLLRILPRLGKLGDAGRAIAGKLGLFASDLNFVSLASRPDLPSLIGQLETLVGQAESQDHSPAAAAMPQASQAAHSETPPPAEAAEGHIDSAGTETLEQRDLRVLVRRPGIDAKPPVPTESEAKVHAIDAAKETAEAEHRKKVADAKAKAVAQAKAQAEAKVRQQAERAGNLTAGDIRELLASGAASPSAVRSHHGEPGNGIPA